MIYKTLHRKLTIDDKKNKIQTGWSTHVVLKWKHILLY